QLLGRLGKTPEIKTFENGQKLARFSMATDDSYKDKNGEQVKRTDWHTIVVRNGLVTVVENYLEKGQEVLISGKLTHRSWDDNDGQKHYITEVICRELVMLSKPA